MYEILFGVIIRSNTRVIFLDLDIGGGISSTMSASNKACDRLSLMHGTESRLFKERKEPSCWYRMSYLQSTTGRCYDISH